MSVWFVAMLYCNLISPLIVSYSSEYDFLNFLLPTIYLSGGQLGFQNPARNFRNVAI